MFVGRVTGSTMSLLPSRWIITRSPGNSNSTGIRTAWLRLLRNSLASLGLDGVNRGAGMAWFSNVYATLYMPDRNGRAMRLFLVSRHGSDVVGCAQAAERSARRIACPYRAVLAIDATPRCASMASPDRQMIGDATPGAGRYVAQAAGSIAGFIQNMHIPNMDGIQSYSLFGESRHLPDVLHCETIAARSVLHGWELAPHRHLRLHQLLLIESGSGSAQLDGDRQARFAGALVQVPPGHVHAFRFQPHTQGWVTTLADEFMDQLFVRVGDVRRDLARPAIVGGDI